ncbi:MAG: methionyl-tRNA formyltransferase, partial [Pseudomonadota bacterium]
EQRFLHVAPRETARSLYDKQMVALSSMVDGAIKGIASGSPRRDAQDETYATFAARRRPSDGEIDWHRSAEQIDRLIRAVGEPYPGAYCDYGTERLTIWQASFTANSTHHANAGQVVGLGDGFIDVVTGDGLLRIEKWDLTGDKPLRMHVILGRNS